MQLVAIPTVPVSLCVALAAPVASLGQFGQYLFERLPQLPSDPLELRLPNFAFLRSSPPGLPGNGFSRHRQPLHRRLTCFDRRTITADVANQLTAQVFLDQRFVYAFGQLRFSELGKGPRETRFIRQPFPYRKTADPLQGTIYPQPFDQRRRRAQPQYGLRYERIGQRPAIMRPTTHTPPRAPSKFFEPHPFKHVNQLLQFRCQRANLQS